jgi:hypothetical protein
MPLPCLITARTLRGDLSGAQDALAPVLALEPERRTEALSRRLTNLGRMLGAHRYRDAAEAGRLGEAIEDFTVCGLGRVTARRGITSSGVIRTVR